MKKKNKKPLREAWVCIAICEAEEVRKGADAPMRSAVEKAIKDLNLKEVVVYSGWGTSEEHAELLNRVHSFMPVQSIIPHVGMKK